MSNLQDSYTKIYALLHELDPMPNFLNQTRKPKLSDKQLIALTLAAEALGVQNRGLQNRGQMRVFTISKTGVR